MTSSVSRRWVEARDKLVMFDFSCIYEIQRVGALPRNVMNDVV